MKKLLFIAMSIVSLAGCEDKERYSQAVLAQIQKDQQLEQQENTKSYHVDMNRLADCVIETSATQMPGLFPFDPARLTAYRNYTKMLTLSDSKDPKKTLDELRNDFGSPKALAEANSNFTQSQLDCYAAMISETEDEAKAAKPAAPAQ